MPEVIRSHPTTGDGFPVNRTDPKSPEMTRRRVMAFLSIEITRNDPKSPEVTRSDPTTGDGFLVIENNQKSPEVTRSHPKSPEVTRGRVMGFVLFKMTQSDPK